MSVAPSHLGSVTMRVLLVSPLPPPYGGISHWTRSAAAYFEDSADVDLRVMNTSPRFRTNISAPMVARLSAGAPQMVLDSVRFVFWMVRWGPDVVHVNTSGSLAHVRDVFMVMCCRLMRVPVIVHLRHGRVPNLSKVGGWEWTLAKFVSRQADFIIVLDRMTKEALRAAGVRQVIQLPNFVTATDQTPDTVVRGSSVLFVGWMLESKGVIDLLRAWANERKPGWTLDLVGPKGSETAVLRALENSDDTVRILGELDNAAVRRAMSECGIFALPSHSEGFPNVVVEAMASGAPLIASSVGAIPEMLDDGRVGILVPPKDVGALSAAIQILISNSDERLRLGDAARDRCKTLYMEVIVLAQLQSVWRAACNQKE